MRRLVCLALCAAMLLGVAPALAEEPAAKIASEVKGALGIDDHYTQFYAESYEAEGRTMWNLSWSDDAGGSAEVACGADGRIYRYYVNAADQTYDWSPYFVPGFPKLSVPEATDAGKAFLAKVLTGDEGARIDEERSGLSRNGQASASLSGVVTLGGVPTENTFSLEVNSDTGVVTSYWRSDGYIFYEKAAELPMCWKDAGEADAALSEKLSLSLEYVLDGDRAVLRYVPSGEGDWVMNAVSGEMIDRSESPDLAARANGVSAMEMFSMKDADGAALTEVEKAGAALLDGAMSREALDAAARGLAALGLTEEYSLSEVNCTVDRETGDVTAAMVYRRDVTRDQAAAMGASEDALSQCPPDEKQRMSKYVDLDAYTGELKRVWTDYPWWDSERAKADPAENLREVGSFLRQICPEALQNSMLDKTDGENGNGAGMALATYAYSRQNGGVPYRADGIWVTYNASLHCVDSYSLSWTEDLAFDGAVPAVSPEKAMAAYRGAMPAELVYCNLPSGERDGETMYALTLCYALSGKTGVMGVDARTGEVVLSKADEATAVRYDDVGTLQNPLEMAKMAEYGVGYPGGSVRGTDAATWRDLLGLLVSADGYAPDADDETLLQWAKNAGCGAPKLDDRVTRGEAARALVEISGYGAAAALPDIFVCGFADDADISAKDYGYLAIAKGLGLAVADGEGMFRPGEPVTREDAAMMLYRYLARQR